MVLSRQAGYAVFVLECWSERLQVGQLQAYVQNIQFSKQPKAYAPVTDKPNNSRSQRFRVIAHYWSKFR